MKYSLPVATAVGISILMATLGFVTIASAQATTTMTASAAPSACPLITAFMKQGNANEASQVALLQSFLKNTEHLDVDVTGIFDQKTTDAVKAFQKQYLTETMGPWGATQGSGIVYVTTVKKINQIACGTPLSLNGSELATIAAYRQNMASGTMAMATNPAMPSAASADMSGPGVPTMTGPTAPSQMMNSDAMGRGSFRHRLKEFIMSLF